MRLKNLKQDLIAISIVLGILILAAVYYFDSKSDIEYSKDIQVRKTWNLPSQLREISGISHINQTQIACVQDEIGVIFIYDLNKEEVIQTIEFGSRGDYESIRVLGSDAFVLESNGDVYQIINFESKDRKINKYQTDFTSFNDMESFDYSSALNEFLIIPKENNLLKNRDKFIIYKLDPEDLKIMDERLITLSYESDFFEIDSKGWLEDQGFLASELTINPVTKDIYILDARVPKLMILHPDGSPKQLFMLDPEKFQKPEGLSFDSKGQLYISNEEQSFKSQNLLLVDLESN